MSRPMGLSPAIGSSVRSSTMTFFLPRKRPHHCRFREGAEHVDVNRPDRDAALLAQVVHRGFDVLRGRTQRHEHGVGILGLVLGDQSVVTAGQITEVLIGCFQELEDRLGEVVATRDHALHVVLLVLHRAEEHGVREVDHLRHAPAPWDRRGSRWLSVGQSMMSSGAPRYSRMSADSCL